MKSMKCLLIICMSLFLFASASGDIGSFEAVAGSPFTAGASPFGVAFSPFVNGKLYAAVSNGSDDTLSVYSVDTATGVFTAIDLVPPVATESGPQAVAFSPVVNGKLYAGVVCYDHYFVYIYSVDLDTGLFTPVNSGGFATAGESSGFAFSPLVDGKLYAAVSSELNDNVSVYSVDVSTGFLTEVAGSPFTAGDSPSSVAFSPFVDGKLFAAVSNRSGSSNSVSVYEVNIATGVFTPVTGSPFDTGYAPAVVAFSPLVGGKLFAATADYGSDTATVFSVNTSTGVFTQTSSFAVGSSPQGIAFSPLADGVVVAAITNSGDNTVISYIVNMSTGAFTQVSSPLATGSTPLYVAFSPAINGKLFAATANSESDNTSVFSVTIPPPPPYVTSIFPSRGPSEGGISVIIRGSHFTGATSVRFGIFEAVSFIVISDDEIIAVLPPGIGIVDVIVTTVSGSSAPSPFDQFTYFLPPEPPVDVKGCKKFNRCNKNGGKFDLNIVTWKAPLNSSTIVAYNIYKNKGLSNLEAVVPANDTLRYTKCTHRQGKQTYYVVSVDAFGQTSAPVKVKAKKFCKNKKRPHRNESSNSFSSSCSAESKGWKKWLKN